MRVRCFISSLHGNWVRRRRQLPELLDKGPSPGCSCRRIGSRLSQVADARGGRSAHTGLKPAYRDDFFNWLQVVAEADACGLIVFAECAAQAEGRTLADLLRITDRHRALAVLPTGAHRNTATRAAAAGGIDRHVHHRGVHRAHAVDALILLAEP